jgi:hypothetical protein
LEPEIRKLGVYQLKLTAESRFENNQEGVSRQYEDLRFSLRGDYEKVALKGHCLNCKREGNLGLHYSEYIKIITGNARGARCPHCKGKESFIISN